MNIELSTEAVALLGDLLPRVRQAVADKHHTIAAAIEAGILNPSADAVGVFLMWQTWPEQMLEDLAAVDEILGKLAPVTIGGPDEAK